MRLLLVGLIACAVAGCAVMRTRVPPPPPTLDDAFWRSVFDGIDRDQKEKSP